MKHQIFNICSNNPIKLLDIINDLNRLTTKNLKYIEENYKKQM